MRKYIHCLVVFFSATLVLSRPIAPPSVSRCTDSKFISCYESPDHAILFDTRQYRDADYGASNTSNPHSNDASTTGNAKRAVRNADYGSSPSDVPAGGSPPASSTSDGSASPKTKRYINLHDGAHATSSHSGTTTENSQTPTSYLFQTSIGMPVKRKMLAEMSVHAQSKTVTSQAQASTPTPDLPYSFYHDTPAKRQMKKGHPAPSSSGHTTAAASSRTFHDGLSISFSSTLQVPVKRKMPVRTIAHGQGRSVTSTTASHTPEHTSLSFLADIPHKRQVKGPENSPPAQATAMPDHGHMAGEWHNKQAGHDQSYNGAAPAESEPPTAFAIRHKREDGVNALTVRNSSTPANETIHIPLGPRRSEDVGILSDLTPKKLSTNHTQFSTASTAHGTNGVARLRKVTTERG